MRLFTATALVFGLFTLLFVGCGASSDELITAVVTAEDARARLIARDEIVDLGEDGIEVFSKLLDFDAVRNLFENEVSSARLSEMSEEDILDEVTDIRITAVRGMATIGSTDAAQPLIDASYLPESEAENLGEPIAIGDDELLIEHAARFRREVMTALGQLAFGSEEEREKAIDLFSYGANDPDPGVRISTAGSLAALHLHESGYFLKQLAVDEVIGVRAATFNAIHAIGSYYINHAERSLIYGDEKTAELDRRHLGALKDSLYEHCLNALEDPEPAVRIPVIHALDVFDDPSSVTPLMLYLADANERIRVAVVDALCSFENEEGAKAVTAAAINALGKDDEPQRRMMAALVLGRTRTGGEALKEALIKPDELWFVRLQLINSLANVGDQEYLSIVYRFLDDPDRDVRVAAIGAVGSLGSEEDLDRLMGHAFEDETLIPAVTHAVASIAGYDDLQPHIGAENDQRQRLIAIDALGMKSDPQSPVPQMLVDLFSDEDIGIVQAALGAAALYDFSQIADELAALTERGEENYTIFEETKDVFEELAASLNEIYSVKMRAASMLASFDNRDGINHFIETLEDSSVGRRLISVSCLGNIGHTRGVMPTVGLLDDGSDYVRWGAVQVLGTFADQRTTGFLTHTLEDANPWVQQSAVDSLQAIGDKNTIEDVYGILAKDVEPSVKVAALDFISRLGDKRMADDVAVYLEDTGAGIRFAAATCLTRLNDDQGRGIEFLKEELKSNTILTIDPGLPAMTPFEVGVMLLAAELTGTPESRIQDLVTEPVKIIAWAYATRILTGDIASAETYGILAEKALVYRHLRTGLLENAVQMRPAAYTAFEPYLEDGDPVIRQLGYAIMVRIGGDRVINRLTEQIQSHPEDAPALIAAIDDLGARTRLRELFRTGDEPVRVLVAQRIAGWTDKRMPLIWGQIATEDQSLTVRMTVLDSLAADPTGVGRAYLTQIIDNPDSPPELISAARDALAAVELPPPPPEEAVTVG
jgi:HEAT repeat protein